ncbi:MAG: DUF971 domain-containing protein [Planctomycetota bacterium]|nr:MAG: DUF971 domain-containing protein [Planctomycetota bacterium]
MDPRPTKLERRDGSKLLIEWSDGERREISFGELRKACPCATCREKHGAPPEPSGGLPVLSAAEARPLTIEGMRPVGHYAYAIAFSDGHDSGIYTLELLRSLGEPVAE